MFKIRLILLQVVEIFDFGFFKEGGVLQFLFDSDSKKYNIDIRNRVSILLVIIK